MPRAPRFAPWLRAVPPPAARRYPKAHALRPARAPGARPAPADSQLPPLRNRPSRAHPPRVRAPCSAIASSFGFFQRLTLGFEFCVRGRLRTAIRLDPCIELATWRGFQRRAWLSPLPPPYAPRGSLPRPALRTAVRLWHAPLRRRALRHPPLSGLSLQLPGSPPHRAGPALPTAQSPLHRVWLSRRLRLALRSQLGLQHRRGFAFRSNVRLDSR